MLLTHIMRRVHCLLYTDSIFDLLFLLFQSISQFNCKQFSVFYLAVYNFEIQRFRPIGIIKVGLKLVLI